MPHSPTQAVLSQDKAGSFLQVSHMGAGACAIWAIFCFSWVIGRKLYLKYGSQNTNVAPIWILASWMEARPATPQMLALYFYDFYDAAA